MKNAWNNITYWKLSIYKCISGSFIVGLTFLVTSLSNMEWANMSTQSKITLIAGMIVASLKSVDMFLDQTLQRERNIKSETIAKNNDTGP